MTESAFTAKTAFDGIAMPGRYGWSGEGEAPLVITPRPILTMTQIAVRRGKATAVREAALTVAGVSLPTGPAFVAADGLMLIGIAPEQWLAVAESEPAALRLERLESTLSGTATLVDQSNGKAILRIAGPRCRDVLAKGCSLDLHERVFRPGDAATTPIALMPCHLWQLDGTPSYDVAVASSYVKSFWRWLAASAAEYGFTVAQQVGIDR